MKLLVGMTCFALLFGACCSTTSTPRIELTQVPTTLEPRINSEIMRIFIDEAYRKHVDQVVIDGHLQNVPGFTLSGPLNPVLLKYYSAEGAVLKINDGGYLQLPEDFLERLTYYYHFQIKAGNVPADAASVSVHLGSLASEPFRIRN